MRRAYRWSYVPACLCVLIFTLCVFVCVCAVSLSSPMHPVPACPAFRQLQDQPWGVQYNLLCILATFNGWTGISFRANCPDHSSADAAIQANRTVLDSVGSGGNIFIILFNLDLVFLTLPSLSVQLV